MNKLTRRNRNTQYAMVVLCFGVIIALFFSSKVLRGPLLVSVAIVASVSLVLVAALALAWRVHKRKQEALLAAAAREDQ